MKNQEFEKKYNETINNPRYAKIKSATVKKSKHKHEKHDFLFSFQEVDFVDSNKIKPKTCRATLCVHCGKLYEIFSMEHERIDENRRVYRFLRTDEVRERYKHLNHFNLDIIVRHSYDLHDNHELNIREMYANMVKVYLTNENISDEDITHGLINDIKPEEMAKLILNKRKD